jgi:hypothetical protein
MKDNAFSDQPKEHKILKNSALWNYLSLVKILAKKTHTQRRESWI